MIFEIVTKIIIYNKNVIEYLIKQKMFGNIYKSYCNKKYWTFFGIIYLEVFFETVSITY